MFNWVIYAQPFKSYFLKILNDSKFIKPYLVRRGSLGRGFTSVTCKFEIQKTDICIYSFIRLLMCTI